MNIILCIFVAIFLGVSHGGNDGGNVYGIAVGAKIISFKTAAVLSSIFVLIGAFLQGKKSLLSVSFAASESGITSPYEAAILMLSVALTVFFMTYINKPISTSQCIVGSIIGYSLSNNTFSNVIWFNFISAWFITPLSGMLIAYILCYFFKDLKIKPGLLRILHVSIIIFNAYSVGANTTANITGIFVNFITLNWAIIVGGFSVALGVLIFSKGVGHTIGNKITTITPFDGLAAQLACGTIIYGYTLVGIPVSSSQAIVGALIGVGLYNDRKAVNFQTVKSILFAWINSPLISMAISYLMFSII